MFTEKHYLDQVDGKKLDAYLDRGWYRMGQAVFTCRFLIFHGTLFPAIWVRLSLDNYKFSKRKRKRVATLSERFDTVIRPFELTSEKEDLYQIYRKQFPAKIAPTLSAALLDDSERNIFESHEIAVYDEGALIAFSVFDLGEDSIASILGVYHPAYSKYSMGMYSMLREIEFGIQSGFKYYYPGYVVPGYDKFNYKLQIGAVDYFNEELFTWEPYESLKESMLFTNIIKQKLEDFKVKLARSGIEAELFLYPPYEANLLGYWILDYLDYPIIILLPGRTDEYKLVICYDHRQNRYHFYECTVYDSLADFFKPYMDIENAQYPLMLELLLKDQTVIKSSSEQVVLDQVSEKVQAIKRSGNV